MSQTHGHTQDHGHIHGHSHDHSHGHGHDASAAIRAPRPVKPGFSLFRLSAPARLGGAAAASLLVWAGVIWALG